MARRLFHLNGKKLVCTAVAYGPVCHQVYRLEMIQYASLAAKPSIEGVKEATGTVRASERQVHRGGQPVRRTPESYTRSLSHEDSLWCNTAVLPQHHVASGSRATGVEQT